MLKNDYISFDEFVDLSGYKKKTVMRRCRKNEIPGIIREGKKYYVLSGTRYPYDVHRYKLTDSDKRRFVLLKAISEYKYISHLELKLEKKQFDVMLKDLFERNYICKNNLSNNYGANAYDCTVEGNYLLKQYSKSKKIELAQMCGAFVGSAMKTINE